jgi:lipopolysaccharide biosynthesis glycosyltransferase
MNNAFLYCTDDNYVEHSIVSIFSLLTSTTSRLFDICIVGDDLSIKSLNKLSMLSDVFNVNLHFIDCKEHLSKYISIRDTIPDQLGHVSHATFLRLIFDAVLPVEYEKIVYIDADTIIRGDLTGLFEISLEGNIIAASRDIMLNKRFTGDRVKLDYFNAGFMVIDRTAWKKHNVEKSLAEIASKQSASRLQYLDQDILNTYFLSSGYLSLDCRYNYQYLMTIDNIRCSNESSLDEAKVIHYAGQIKPWHLWASQNYSSLYRSYRQVIPWLGKFFPEAPASISQLKICAKTLMAQGRFQESAIYSQKLLGILENSSRL